MWFRTSAVALVTEFLIIGKAPRLLGSARIDWEIRGMETGGWRLERECVSAQKH